MDAIEVESDFGELVSVEPDPSFFPENELETVAIGRVKWVIHDWETFSKKAKRYSPEFSVGGRPWRFLVFPTGNKVAFLSMYIEHVEKPDYPPNWHCCAEFSLGITNFNDDSIFHRREAQHRFSRDGTDWGFTNFVANSSMTQSSADADIATAKRPYVENNKVVLHASVRIVKDDIGTLWHNFMRWDSKIETGFVGLKNQGATCYMNSLLQSLYFTNLFRKSVYNIPTQSDDPQKSVALALQKVFYNLQTQDVSVGTTELTRSFGWDQYEAFMQHDVQELNRVLQDNLETRMKGTTVEGMISKLFEGKMKSFIKCINVNFESTRVESFYDIQLNVKDMKNITESFQNYCLVETLDGENRYFAEGYGLQEARKGVIFEKLPPVLHLQLKRFEYDFNRDMMVKLNDRFEYPLVVDLDSFLSESAEKSVPQRYHLHGVLVHMGSGDFHGGHYCAFIRPERDGKWFKFDDDRVIPVGLKEVLEDNYGGDPDAPVGPTTPIGPQQQTNTRIRLKRHVNAYMLVYIRESDMDEVLAPIETGDIPKELVERFEQDRAIELQKKKEREEMHLYLQAKVLTDDLIREYHGNDIFSWDDTNKLISFKLKRSDTIGSFKATLSNYFSIPLERIKLWNVSERQNKTLRPDTIVHTDQDETLLESLIGRTSAKTLPDVHFYLESPSLDLSEELEKEWESFSQSFPRSTQRLIFIKYYDPAKRRADYVARLMILPTMQIGRLCPFLARLVGLPPDVQFTFHEEVKPQMIEPMRPTKTFGEVEIGDGDIVCCQKVGPIPEDVEDYFRDVPSYFDHLFNLTVVRFRPSSKGRESNEDIVLKLSRKMPYDALAEALAREVKCPPMKLRFIYGGSGTEIIQPPRHTFKRTPSLTLGEMLKQGHHGIEPLLYFEVAEISFLDLESNSALKITWLNSKAQEGEHNVLVPNTGKVADLITAARQSLNLGADIPVRVWDVINHKSMRPLAEDIPISTLQDASSLVLEEVPKDEEGVDLELIATVVHYQKELTHLFGVPFKFVVKQGETYKEACSRLQAKLGLSDKDWAKYKVTLIDLQKIKPFADDDILSDFDFGVGRYLGLDHVDKTAKANRGGEKAIKIQS